MESDTTPTVSVVTEDRNERLLLLRLRYPGLFSLKLHPDAQQIQGTPQWEEQRRKYWITASMIPAVLFCDDYTPYKEIARIIHGNPPKPKSDWAVQHYLQPGQEWEKMLKEYLVSQLNTPESDFLLADCGTYRFCLWCLKQCVDKDPSHQCPIVRWVGATPDAFLINFYEGSPIKVYTVEIKWRASLNEVEDITLQHWLQIQTQLLATGRPSAIYVSSAVDSSFVALIERGSTDFRDALKEDLRTSHTTISNGGPTARPPWPKRGQQQRYLKYIEYDRAVVVSHPEGLGLPTRLQRITHAIKLVARDLVGAEIFTPPEWLSFRAGS